MKRLLALVVTLAMVLSVLPTSVLALETDSSAEPEVTAAGETVVDTTDPAEEEKPLAEEEKPAEETSKPEETPAEEAPAEQAPAEEALPEEASEEKTPEQEAAVSYPAQDFKGKDNGVTVDVTAEEGAFPEGTTMKVTKVTDNNVIAAVKNAVEGEVATVKAVDIAFFNAEGTEIEPLKEIHVKLTSDVVKQAETPVVVHVDDEGEAKVIEDTNVKKDAVAFDVDAFSVYAVVDPGSTVDEARATVNFISKDDTIATFYVKNSDTAEELKTIVYDPGVGTLDEGEMFLGWTLEKNYDADSERMTVDEVRDYMETLEIKEGTTVNFYAVISKVITLTYVDEKGVTLGSNKIRLIGSADSGDVTVNQAYTAPTSDQNFEGWIVTNGASNITKAVYNGEEITGGGTEANPYQNGTVLTIKGNVTLSVDAPKGHWLVFNENGKGATYNAPQFVKSGEKTAEPRPDAEMQRFGYTFDGWYTDKACTTAFTFGNELTESTTIYAKWTANTTANYTVIIWKQNVNDAKDAADSAKTYDFAESITLSGNVGSTINAVTATDSGDNRYARINNQNYRWTGFHLNRYDTGKTIATEGTTVVNVYYDRNLVTLTFQYRGNNRWNTQATMTGLYGSTLASNGYTWPTNRWWYNDYDYDWYGNYSGSGTRTTFLDAFILPSGGSSQTFYGFAGSGNKHIYFYKQNADDNGYTQANDATASGTFYITDKYNGFKAASYSTNNQTWTTLGNKDGNGIYATVPSNNYTNLYIRFDRLKYNILYMDGVYVDGNGNPVEGESSRGELKDVKDVVYGSDTSSYNKGGANYYEPAYNGFVFDGWYTDDKCTQPYTFTTMPEGITVYAKWVQTQYRVFLHPNAGTDPTLDWGSTTQAMNFRVSYGGKVSAPTGTRTEYEMIGWYLDEACTKAFNADAYTLNDTTVTADYDKTKDFTDPMDKWGNGATTNADVDRPWITKKLDVYAKWRAVLVGADGIGVLYDANGGTNAPTDKTLYLDSADAVAQAAPTAPEGKQFKHWVVQKWDENENKYVDTAVTVEPGEIYTVLKENAKVEPKEGSTEQNPAYTYTVQLRAEYGDKEVPASTEIKWYSNVKDVNGNSLDLSKFTKPTDTQNPGDGWYVTDKEDGTLRINEAIDIRPADTFTYEGATFLGWAKKADATKDDLFLKYEGGKFYAQAKEGEGDWTVEVTQVAADERDPVDDLYAVWEGSFFIYHSGTAEGNIETHKVEEIEPYTYADRTKLYGGYYLEGGFTMPDDKAAYDGSNWTWTTPQTSKSYTPKVGETIYLKEVPTTYLLPAEIDTFHKNTKQLHGIYLMSSTDDKNYKEAGYVVGGTTYQKGELHDNVKIVPGPNSDFAEKTLKVNDVSGNTSGLILMAQYLQLSGDSYTGFGSAKGLKTIKCYWVTPDGITVTGAKQRAVTVKDANKDGVIKVQQILPEVKYKDAKVKIGILVR